MVSVKLQKEENREAFLKVFPTLAEEVLAELRKYNMPEDAYEWTKKVKNKNKKRVIILSFKKTKKLMSKPFFFSWNLDVVLQCPRW